jgi:RHS repeat-associated protein
MFRQKIIVYPVNGVSLRTVSSNASSLPSSYSTVYAIPFTQVILTGPAPAGGVTLTVGGSRPNIVSFGSSVGGVFSPGTLTIPAGQQIGYLYAQTFPFTGMNHATTVTATYAGVTRSFNLTITAMPQASLARPKTVQCASLALAPCLMAAPVLATSVGDPSGYYLYTPELQLMAETEISTNPTKAIAYSYLWFGGLPVASIEASTNTTRWYATDQLGTPLIQTDNTGAVAWRAEQSPYGTILTFRNGATLHQPLRLPGQIAQDSGDLSYNIFRWYRSGWGRYTQNDPLGLFSGDLNTYGYGRENPVRLIDVDGLSVRACCRSLQSRVLGRWLGYDHCYIESNTNGRRTWGLHNDHGTGVYHMNDPSDVGGTCTPWKEDPCPNNDCFTREASRYPAEPYSYVSANVEIGRGRNSNTFVRCIMDRCTVPAVDPRITQNAPGWYQPCPP